MYSIVVKYETGEIEARSLTDTPEIIGRGGQSTFLVDCPLVEMEHCRIEQRGEVVMLIDLDTSSGTIVNGNAISETVLNPGDSILIGSLEVLLKDDQNLHRRDSEGKKDSSGQDKTMFREIENTPEFEKWKLKPWKVVISDKNMTRTLELKSKTYIIGKDIDSDIVIEGRGIQKTHALFIISEEYIRCIDITGSLTLVYNDTAVKDVRFDVSENDKICIGSSTFLFQK